MMKAKKMPSLNALRVFAVAAHADSFKHAAQQLGVSQSNITRQIQVLEEQLGTRLFHRDNRVHSLTPAGAALAPDLLRLFRELERTIERTRDIGDIEATTLRVGIPESMLRWWLAARLNEFYSLYPHIQVLLHGVPLFPTRTEQAELCASLQHGQLDLAVHYGRLRDSALKQTLLYTPQYIPVSADNTTQPFAERTWLLDLASPCWSHFKKQHSAWSRSLTVRPIAPVNIAIDVLAGTPDVTLVDRLFLSHPQLQNYRVEEELAVVLPEAMMISTKHHQQQPVAHVAFTKWLQARLPSALVDSVPPS